MGHVNQKDKSGRTATLTNVRVSFADSLHTASLPKKNKSPDAKPKHGANFILEKGSPDFDSNKAACISAMKAAGVEFKRGENWWKTLWDDKPDNLSFKKGDRFKTESGEIYKGYEGNIVVAAKGPAGGQKRPQMRDRNKRIIEVSEILDVVYNGTYADVIISWYGTENGGTPRITCSVESIRSRQEGERLGGGGIYVDDDDFDTLPQDNSFDDGPSTSAASKKPASDDFDLGID